ncbi:DUF63 family protein [Halobium salinum]|uniref:DUF63 family protein n=1 Tax=Halobium salinum TaxID=1364940 RepID=A0ABD5P9E8_9EURY|nr:DUF63 family protein [Halobium salinum]
MQVLPEGFSLPPVPYLLALLLALGVVAFGLYRRRPTVTERHVLALAPWMVAGSAFHVLYALNALPAALRPLGGTAAVYLVVAVLAGATWLLADRAGDGGLAVPVALASTGAVAFLASAAVALAWGVDNGSLRLGWAALILVGGCVVAAATWAVLARVRPAATSVTGWVGVLAVFGHALDAVSTAVGIDILGFAERTPASRFIIEVGNSLPTAEFVGGAWLFVLVKLLVAGAIVTLFADYVREEPTEGYLLLGLVAAVGLGPGAHNVVLFTVA